MSFSQLIHEMTGEIDTENIITIDSKSIGSVLRVRCKMKTFSGTNGRWFFYITDLGDLNKYIPEISPTDHVLIIVILDTYSLSNINIPECVEFIGDFNKASFSSFPFIHECTDVTPAGTGFSVLQGVEYKPRTGTKPQKSLVDKMVHRISNKKDEYRVAMDYLWIHTPSGANYVLKDIKFFMQLE